MRLSLSNHCLAGNPPMDKTAENIAIGHMYQHVVQNVATIMAAMRSIAQSPSPLADHDRKSTLIALETFLPRSSDAAEILAAVASCHRSDLKEKERHD